jgi:hypothetical protein
VTPVEFLLARVTDLEAKARVARDGMEHRWMVDSSEDYGLVVGEYGPEDRDHTGWVSTSVVASFAYADDDDHRTYRGAPDVAAHIATWDPAFVLAWCTAVRAILSVHHQMRPGWCATCDVPGDVQGSLRGCLTIRALLQPFADHPDFDPAWRQEEA